MESGRVEIVENGSLKEEVGKRRKMELLSTLLKHGDAYCGYRGNRSTPSVITIK